MVHFKFLYVIHSGVSKLVYMKIKTCNGTNPIVLLHLYFYYICGYACFCIRSCHGVRYPQTQKGCQIPRAGITGSSELTDMGSWNQIHALWKNNRHS